MGRQRIAVVTDSSAYLPPDVRERLDIAVIPLSVVWGEEVFRDGVDMGPQAFYERLQSDQVMPTTSQPSAGEFVDFFQQVARERRVDSVVGVFISSRLSGTVASAETAKGMLPELHVEVLDSLSTSMGLAFQAMAAGEVAQTGGTLKEVREAVERVRYRQQLLFVVDTLEFLHRGGRIGGGKRFLGTALKIKPLLELEDGRIEALEQVRSRKKALGRMLQVMEERRADAPVVRAGVIHANSLDAGLALKEQVQAVLEPGEMFVSELSPAIGTHAGPGTLGVAFYTQ